MVSEQKWSQRNLKHSYSSAKKLLQTHSKAKGKTLLIKVNDLSENERKKELVNIS